MKKALDIQSMTGFAQGSGSLSDFSWVWETKSLNSKGLDIRIRVPNGFSELEQAAREYVKKFKPPYKGKTSAYSEKFTPYHIDASASFIPTIPPSGFRIWMTILAIRVRVGVFVGVLRISTFFSG